MHSLRYLLLAVFCISVSSLSAQDNKKVKKKAEKSYTIFEKTSKISRADIRKNVKGTENIIQIDALNASGGVALMNSAPLPPARITNIALVRGSYNMTRELSQTGRGMSTQLLDVVFPCRIRVTVSNEVLDFEITEPGFWKVSLALVN